MEKEAGTEVNLTGYECKFFGVSYIHTELQLISNDYQLDISWSRDKLTITQAFDRGDLVEKISLGIVYIDEEKLYDIAYKIARKFRSYSVLKRNCRHYARQLIHELRPTYPFDALDRLHDLLWLCDMVEYFQTKIADFGMKKLISYGLALLFICANQAISNSGALISNSMAFFAPVYIQGKFAFFFSQIVKN